MTKHIGKLREFKIVLLIIMVLSALAFPHFVGASKDAIAAKIVCDFNMISKAAMTAYSVNDEFPASGEWGQLPEEFTSYLPHDFKFCYKNVTYRWRCWSLPSGLPKDPSQKVLLGLQVRTEDAQLLNSIVTVYQGRITQLKEDQVTLVIL
ncbi:MAG: hypothetical protein ABIA59_08830 [Candidatus Latescibacterota bacterium]